MANEFDMKPQIDPVAVAGLFQRKAEVEIDAKRRQREQNIQNVKDAADATSRAVSGMVEESKQRQKMDFIKSAANMWRPVGAPSTGPLTEGQSGQQSMVRNAMLANPDHATKSIIDSAFPQASMPNSAKALAFQRMSLRGSDGKDRQVSVGVLNNQLVNPNSLQPINIANPADVDALPKYGFVERENIVGTDEQGMPIYHNPVAQTRYGRDSKGEAVPSTGPILPKLENPSDRMTKEVQFITETRLNLEEGIKHFKPQFVGPIAGRVAPIKEWFNDLTDTQQVKFNQFMTEIDAIKRHELYGSALTSAEKSFFDQISMNTKISPEAFIARMEAAARKLANKEKALMRGAKVSGKAFRSEASMVDQSTPLDPDAEASAFLNDLLGGQ